ncbi:MULTISPECIES: hypothetical protein [unclassified Bradyrhizobium]
MVPQLPEMDLDLTIAAVYAAKSWAAEVRWGILNANGGFSPIGKNSLTMGDA